MSYVRASIVGSTTGGETWSINPVFDPTGEFPGFVDQTALDAAAAAIALLSPGTLLLGLLSPQMAITGCRLEVRDDGDDALIAISVASRGAQLNGTGIAALPPQSALVFSLRTDTPGGSGRGRLYWPAMGAQLAASGRFGTSGTTQWLDAFKLYLENMRLALTAAFPLVGFSLAVRSRLTTSTPHVVRMQAGDVVDTQRRRRDRWPETYVTVNIP